MPKLYCLNGMNKGQEYDLPMNGIVTIGRSEKNTICVFDKKSSRHHCQIYITKDGIVVEDLGSTNGLLLNGELMKERSSLNIGDEIAIGQTVFVVRGESTSGETPLPTPKQKRYEMLLQETTFQATKTTALRKLKTEKLGKAGTGFLSFFEVKDKKNEEDDNDK